MTSTPSSSDTALLVMDVQPGIIDRVADAPAFLKREAIRWMRRLRDERYRFGT